MSSDPEDEKGAPAEGPILNTDHPKCNYDITGEAADTSSPPCSLVVNIQSPQSGSGDWPEIVISGQGDFRPITEQIKASVPTRWRDYDENTGTWRVEPSRVPPLKADIEALDCPVRDLRFTSGERRGEAQ